MLPAGTLSGAPKIRACEIIEDLEASKRGIYGGAMGYLALNGDADFCIAIRLAYKKGGRVYARSGAGIVADSNPEKEYFECANKLRAVIDGIKGAAENSVIDGIKAAVNAVNYADNGSDKNGVNDDRKGVST
jgi:anthranilate synthase component 1